MLHTGVSIVDFCRKKKSLVMVTWVTSVGYCYILIENFINHHWFQRVLQWIVIWSFSNINLHPTEDSLAAVNSTSMDYLPSSEGQTADTLTDP
ncbi:hypothetical protein GDO78_007374 [Eleutherodactylus coqui]|uniref:Uncharacterized protein n=1 Tax=Eleutherodactylus coqui TaxID=57060 RepID=A0A8J6FGA3_ELECQ|nr:hypothetical protein GDO78_007374 [Eleutherodactylus coqui]